ncbi:reverse transcriptase domain-containing protein, partial [Tanacetum coccineum]
MREGMFLGYKVNADGLKVCPDKADAVLNLPSLRCLKDVQKLNGKLASLKRFLSKSAEKSLPFFKTLKKCTKKSDFQWTQEAEASFKQMKALIAELPMLSAPKEKKELIMYLAAAKEAINAVLIIERDNKQMPVYFVSRALQSPEINYTPMEKLVLALVSASKRLERYFQVHTIIVITDQPIKQLLSSSEITGRLLKWRFELEGYDIHYRPRISFKGQVLADYIVECLEEESADEPMAEQEELPEPWTLFTDGSSCVDSFGAGLILTNQEGVEFTYSMRFRLGANQVNGSYVAKEPSMIQYSDKVKMLASNFREFSIKQVPRSENKKADALSKIASTSFAHLSKQVLVEEQKEKSIEAKFGLPGEIVSDNGKQFCDNPFKDWCEKLCIRQCFASVKHPQANGLVERENRSLGEGIKARLDERSKDWMGELSYVLWVHRTMIKSSNGETPFSLTYGTKAVIPAEIGMPTLRTAEVDMIQNDEALEINLDLPGDMVYRNNDASHAKDGGKLGPKWEGPYEVTEALGKGAYKLRDCKGNDLPRTWNICSNALRAYLQLQLIKDKLVEDVHLADAFKVTTFTQIVPLHSSNVLTSSKLYSKILAGSLTEEIYFDFQKQRFIYSHEKRTFYKLPYPTKETFGHYLKSTGYDIDTQVQIAADKWGGNV